jgi:hypothetical protein
MQHHCAPFNGKERHQAAWRRIRIEKSLPSTQAGIVLSSAYGHQMVTTINMDPVDYSLPP